MKLTKLILEFEGGETKEITDDPENLLSSYGRFVVNEMGIPYSTETDPCWQKEMRPTTGLMGEIPRQFTESQDD